MKVVHVNQVCMLLSSSTKESGMNCNSMNQYFMKDNKCRQLYRINSYSYTIISCQFLYLMNRL